MRSTPIRMFFCVVCCMMSSAAFADTLQEYARSNRLTRKNTKTTIVIDNSRLETDSGRGRLTSCCGTVVDTPELADRTTSKQRGKDYWQRRYRTQFDRVESVRSKLDELDARIADLDRRHFEAPTASRAETRFKKQLSTARGRRAQLQARLKRERHRLQAIVREARKEGAQPGWFRN